MTTSGWDRPAVDECLCGQPNPCETHGQWAGTDPIPPRRPHTPTPPPAGPLGMLARQALWREMDHHDTTHHHQQQEGAA